MASTVVPALITETPLYLFQSMFARSRRRGRTVDSKFERPGTEETSSSRSLSAGQVLSAYQTSFDNVARSMMSTEGIPHSTTLHSLQHWAQSAGNPQQASVSEHSKRRTTISVENTPLLVSFNHRQGTFQIQRRGFRNRTSSGFSSRRTSAHTENKDWISAVKTAISERKIPELKLGAKATQEKHPDKVLNMLKDENSLEKRDKISKAYIAGLATSHPEKKTKFSWFSALFWTFLILYLLKSTFDVRVSGGKGGWGSLLMGVDNEVSPEDISVSFKDVRGIHEAKVEVTEIVEYLKDPEKFSRLGGRLPKGVLLVGPPGTGKTLLARAIAGEAGVPFFHASGSEFDEVLVGQGAKRVRDLFARAKDKSPAVIFIDEIDSVGSKRVSSSLHPYANQTINQLLAEMDGFEQNAGIIVIGATNRRDDLDRALLRPGRFDVEVHVNVPGMNDRIEIFELYLGKIHCGSDVKAETLALRTTGFTGADIESMVNQAAVRAAADGLAEVTMVYLENSRDKVMMGPERKSLIPSEATNRNTAYHEAGHALVAYYNDAAPTLSKVTIIPRQLSLGHTQTEPSEESLYGSTKSQLLAAIDMAMGGRVGEELEFGPDNVSTGALDDFRRATSIATQMVKVYGMSEKIGVRYFDQHQETIFGPSPEALSPSLSDAIDSEIKKILQDSYERAKDLLKVHSKEHKKLAEALLEYETLDADQIKCLLDGNPFKHSKNA